MKKLLSIILSLVLAVTSLGAGTAVFADGTKSVTVSYSVYDGEFKKEPTEIEVSANLSDTYADTVGYNDNSTEPTILDATIAAHLDMFGSVDSLSFSSSGWTLTAFGKDASNFSYRVSGNYSDGITDSVSDGDYVEYMFYQDAWWSDEYTYFNTRNANIYKNESVTLNLSRVGWGEPSPAANATITVNGEAAGKTDSNGKIKLSFDKIGTYIISAENNIGGLPIFAPWCEIEVSTALINYTQKEMQGAAAFLLSSNPTLDVNSAVDYLTYLKSGYDMSAYNDAFLASVKANLDENGGKLVTPAVAGYKSEMGVYGAVIQILFILGINPTDFEGYNLIDAFEKIDLTESYHPYYYRAAIEAASESFAKTLCDKFIADFYVLGSGMSYWGFSCDNTAHFLCAISKYKDSYPEYVKDAKAVIKTYTKTNGAFCDPQWAPDVNADSTALAMMAFASIGDTGTAFSYYKNLIKNFESKKTGVFGHTDKVANALATKDALLSLEYFNNTIEAGSFEHPEEIYKGSTTVKATTSKNGSINKTCAVCGKTSKTTIYSPKTVSLSSNTYTYSDKEKKPKVSVKDKNNKTVSSKDYTVKYSANKNVGTAKVTVTFKGNYSGTLTKTFKINPKTPKNISVKANKGGFTVKWKEQTAQTTGYQIRINTEKGKHVKTVTVSGNKAKSAKITKLKRKTKYIVSVRAYKKAKDGKKYYSEWSALKRYKTK